MGRTADSYLKEQGVKPLNSYYTFAEMSEEQLDAELAHTWEEQRSVKHGEERTAQLGRKILHIMFELNYRLQEELDNEQ